MPHARAPEQRGSGRQPMLPARAMRRPAGPPHRRPARAGATWRAIRRSARACALVAMLAPPAWAQGDAPHDRQALTHHVQVRVPAVAGVLSSSPSIQVEGTGDPGGRAHGRVTVRIASNVPSELRIRLDLPGGAAPPEITAALQGAASTGPVGRGWTTLPGVLPPGIDDLVVTIHAHGPPGTRHALATMRLAFELVPSAAGSIGDVMRHVVEHSPAARSAGP